MLLTQRRTSLALLHLPSTKMEADIYPVLTAGTYCMPFEKYFLSAAYNTGLIFHDKGLHLKLALRESVLLPPYTLYTGI